MRKYGILGAALCLAAGVAGCSGDDAAAHQPTRFRRSMQPIRHISM